MGKFKQARQHQQQRVSRKKVIVICAISATSILICSILIFNLIHPDHIQATVNETDMNVFITPEQTLVNEKNIPAPVMAQQTVANSKIILAKRAKALPRLSSPAH